MIIFFSRKNKKNKKLLKYPLYKAVESANEEDINLSEIDRSSSEDGRKQNITIEFPENYSLSKGYLFNLCLLGSFIGSILSFIIFHYFL